MKSAPAIGLALVLALFMAFVPLAANADRGHGNRGHGWHRGHNVIHVHGHRHHGHWRHGHHHGRLGWWWVVGSAWYFYPRVVYPYPHEQSAVVIQQPPVASGPAPTQYWYFCESSQTYYPYVASCAEGWKPVPAMPQ